MYRYRLMHGYRTLLLAAVSMALGACSQQGSAGGGARLYSGSCAAFLRPIELRQCRASGRCSHHRAGFGR
jgi:hypothetical protein